MLTLTCEPTPLASKVAEMRLFAALLRLEESKTSACC